MEANLVDELGRVFLRLALAEDEKLCDILNHLLPQLFQRLVSSDSEAVTTKMLEIFTHLIKRLKCFPSIQIKLPLLELLPYVDQSVNVAYARNFAILFIEIGFHPEPIANQVTILSRLLQGLHAKSESFQDTFFRLLLHSFQHQKSTSLHFGPDAQRDIDVILDFLLDVMLLPNVSPTRMSRLARVKFTTLEKANRNDIQLECAQFLKATLPGMDGVDVSKWYIHFSVGATADFHTVSTYCKEELERMRKYNLELLDTADGMGFLCHSLLGQPDPTTLMLNDRSPLPEAAALHIIPILCLSKAAANAFPMNLQLICTLLFGNFSNATLLPHIRKAGIDFCVWTLSHSAENMVVAALGPVLYSLLMKIIQDPDSPSDLLHGSYTSLAILARRSPNVISSSAEPFQRLMYRAMREEASRSGSICLEALRTMTVAYDHANPLVLDTIKREIKELSESSSVSQPKFDRVRGALAYWANHLLFKTQHNGGDMNMRKVLLLFSGDASEQVREICTKSVLQHPFPPFNAVVSIFPPSTLLEMNLELVLRYTLEFYIACLKSEASITDTAILPSDVQTVIEACLHLVSVSKYAYLASNTLVALSKLTTTQVYLQHYASRIYDLLLAVESTEVREQLAIALGSLALPEIEVHEFAVKLASFIASSDSKQLQGALSGLSMLVPSLTNINSGIASIVIQQLQLSIQTFNQITHYTLTHELKLQLSLVFSYVQTIGALLLSHSVANVPLALSALLDVLKLTSKDAEISQHLDDIKLRVLQSLACLFYNENDGTLVADCLSVIVASYAENKSAVFQYGVGQVIVSMGFASKSVGPILDKVLELMRSTNSHLKSSGVIYLFCILVTIQESNPWSEFFGFESRNDVHDLLVDYLNESNVFAQECAIKALTMLYTFSNCSQDMSDNLFKRLKCFRAFIDAPSGVQTADDITTAANSIENACYREVSSVAAEVGDPSVMYSLLYLSTSDATWGIINENGPKAAHKQHLISSYVQMPLDITELHEKFTRGQIAQAQNQWHASSIAEQLVPRLFLLKVHPNSKISACMLQLWSLVQKSNPTLVMNYFEQIIKFVLQRMNSKNFKYREAACAALVELLQGRTATDVTAYLHNIWKATIRAVDDVNESVVVASIKLVKCVGELSVRVATADVSCVDAILPFLVDEGIVSAHKLCQALCLGYLLRLVQQLPPHHLKSYLATLPITLLECMSSLEMPELQYAQFHVEDKRQLEKLRVQLSQSGPVGELLQACLSKLRDLSASMNGEIAGIVGELCNGVCTVLRSGVGLNTRVGAATFVVSLVTDLPFEMRSSGGADKLLKSIFVPYMNRMVLQETHEYNDGSEDSVQEDNLRDGLVVRAYGRAAAFVAKFVAQSVVYQYVEQSLLAVPTSIVFDEISGSTIKMEAGRYGWVTVTALTELLHQLPPTKSTNTHDNDHDWCSLVFPIAFVGQFASSAALSAAWRVVLESIPPTLIYSSQYLTTTLAYSTRLVSHLSWESRKQGALAIIALTGSQYTQWISSWEQTLSVLQEAIPGKLWRGKGVLLEALVQVASLVPSTDRDDLLTLLLRECDRSLNNSEMSYFESAVLSLGSLAPAAPTLTSFELLRIFFFGQQHNVPPLLHKRMFESLSKWWPMHNEEDVAKQKDIITWLAKDMLYLPAFHVWSIREAIFGCLGRIISGISLSILEHRELVSHVIQSCLGDLGMRDTKYMAIRKAATTTMVELCRRKDASGAMPVAIVVYKEDIVAMATKLTQESEPTICQVASELLETLRI
ncbi:hypothetical protein THRCLA_04402 [Thraustotheca clavata]|uniref:Proteasome-associated protein ECM29 n=1 Tax=Thraustotheca clavata TaxID=74557 RepID=A0A1V9ZZA8_9STRA|nr:hypothetical protein THRCLA_04402 [Thraustotheca clavata]